MNPPAARCSDAWWIGSCLIVLLIAATAANVGLGAVEITPAQILSILADRIGLHLPVGLSVQQESVFWAIRLPRVLLCLVVGGGLAVCGSVLQGVFRNPLADPGLLGVSSGAAVGAVTAIVTGLVGVVPLGLPMTAFAGGLAATLIAYATARHNGRTEVVTLVLAGVAISAIAGALVGLATSYADDEQLRSIVFWMLGSMAGATWPIVAWAVPFVLLPVIVLMRFRRTLDVLALGEREAGHLGVHVEQVRFVLIVLTALATGAAVAATGVIGFVGLVVPHLLRLIAGPGHRLLLPASALGGAVLLLTADLTARTIVAPTELPLGVVTALVGGPVFLWLLIRTRNQRGGWG